MSGTPKRVYSNRRNVDIGGGPDKAGLPGSIGIPVMLRRFVAKRAPDGVKESVASEPPYTIFFKKLAGDDPTNIAYQDRITPDIWFTRLNEGGPLFNYKYYLDNPVDSENDVIVNYNSLYNDFWYYAENSNGGTIGVKWAILSTTGFPDLNAPGINTNLFGKIGNPTNFFSFSQMAALLRAMIDEEEQPVQLVDPLTSLEWYDINMQVVSDYGHMPYLKNKDLGCYIPSINKYFRIIITNWGMGSDKSGEIEYKRTVLY